MMLRRIKVDVERSLLPKIQCRISVNLTPLQWKWYQSLLSVAASNEPNAIHDVLVDKEQMLHLISQLRKVVNHPKQILLKRLEERRREVARVAELREAGSEFCTVRKELMEPVRDSDAWRAEQELKSLQGESLVKASAKLAMLDRLLLRLRAQGSRVLVFSQYTETLDVLQEYFEFRFGKLNEVFYRLDGADNKVRLAAKSILDILAYSKGSDPSGRLLFFFVT